MYPNTSLAAWQLAVMAVVAIAALAVWLTAVYLAARDPGRHRQAAAGSSRQDVAGERPPAEREQSPAERAAA